MNSLVATMFDQSSSCTLLAVDRHRQIAGREQLLAIRRNAIQHRPGRFVIRQFFEFIVGDQMLFPFEKKPAAIALPVSVTIHHSAGPKSAWLGPGSPFSSGHAVVAAGLVVGAGFGTAAGPSARRRSPLVIRPAKGTFGST